MHERHGALAARLSHDASIADPPTTYANLSRPRPVCLCSAQMFEKQIVIDGKGHLLGRLASVVAKELLNGQCIVVVRSEQIFVTGSRKCDLEPC